jgi:predicted phosphodiesterase
MARTTRLIAISDLHTDFGENRLLLEQLPDGWYQDDVLIVAGDISDQYARIGSTLSLLRAKFREVFYVPGNHELWVRKEPYTSAEKFLKIQELCAALGIHTQPAKVEGVWIVPLLSWYQASFDAEDKGEVRMLNGWADFHCCRWPIEAEEVAEFFLAMNRPSLKSYDGPVISFSHFLPRRELLPATDRLRFKGLPKVAGCRGLDEQIRHLRSCIHIFGHSHISCDRLIDGVRYVQNPLRYPHERRFSGFPLKVVAELNGAGLQAHAPAGARSLSRAAEDRPRRG